MTASCIEQKKFENSIDFSHLKNKIIVCIGVDRGGGDVINMLRIGNRTDGNTAEHSIPISVVEKATEDYDVLKKTVYNKQAQNLLLPILLDELCTFTMKFADVVKCSTIRLMKDGKPLKVSLLSISFSSLR